MLPLPASFSLSSIFFPFTHIFPLQLGSGNAESLRNIYILNGRLLQIVFILVQLGNTLEYWIANCSGSWSV